MERVNCPLCGSDRHRELLVVEPRRIVRCVECGVVFRNPRPVAVAYEEEFESGRAEVLDESWLGSRRASTFTRFLDTWPERPGCVLDVGCGGGWFLKAAAERGWRGIGVDLSPAAVRYARERLGVDARQGTVAEQRFEPASFDLVTLWNVLEVLPDPLGVLQTAHDLVRPGGAVYLRTQNYPFQRVAFVATRIARCVGLGAWLDRRPYVAFIFNATGFSNRTIRLALERAGLRVDRVAPSPPSTGDPYRALGGREWPLHVVKRAADLAARTAYRVSGECWVAGASLEALARRPLLGGGLRPPSEPPPGSLRRQSRRSKRLEDRQ
jgi:2-polyprenyl-3-methyl-5-hydroxy-6-metoxy-1,4-benzoquinol methylase